VEEVEEDGGGEDVLLRRRGAEQLKQTYFERIVDCVRTVRQLLPQPLSDHFVPQQVVADEAGDLAHLLLELSTYLMLLLLITHLELLHILENLQAVARELNLIVAPVAAGWVELLSEYFRLENSLKLLDAVESFAADLGLEEEAGEDVENGFIFDDSEALVQKQQCVHAFAAFLP
jgi:hypothetical protein